MGASARTSDRSSIPTSSSTYFREDVPDLCDPYDLYDLYDRYDLARVAG